MTVQEFFNSLNNASTWSAGVAFKRTNPLPLDKFSVFRSESELSTYITSGGVAYPGQIVAVYDSSKETMKAYIINSVGAGGTYKAVSGDLLVTGEGSDCIQQARTNAYGTGTTVFAVGKNTTAVGNNATIEGGSSLSLPTAHPGLILAYDENAEEDIPFQAVEAEWDAAHSRCTDKNNPDYTDADPVAAGMFAVSWGNNTHVEGIDCIAALTGHAEGRRTKATGRRAHSEGTDTAATGSNSHVEGQDSVASGSVAHAEGYATEAKGPHSHAEGVGSKAIAQTSHAEGHRAQTKTAYSHAEGNSTIAAGIDAQHVQGRYNVEDTEGKYAHIVGWGTSSLRKNIHTLDTEGNAIFAGDVTAGTVSLKEISSTATGALEKANSAYNLAETKPGTRKTWKAINPTTKQEVIHHADIMNSNNTVQGNGWSTGNCAFVAGYGNNVTKDHGMALGVQNIVNHASAIALGTGLVPTAGQQVVVGLYNDPTDTRLSNAVFVVGSGSYDGSKKSNGLIVRKDGKVQMATLETGKASLGQTEADSVHTDFLECYGPIQIGSTQLSEEQLKKILTFIETVEIGGNE